ncbi:MAG: tyrosine-type recombinase/integrase [Pirellulaceae bacterium]
MTVKSSKKTANGKPDKPYPDFPLFAHSNGRWAKKIKGKLCYFGQWGKRENGKLKWIDAQGNWQPALNLYQAQRDDLHSGRKPRATSADGLTVYELCNRFLTAKERQRQAGDITQRTFNDYDRVCQRIIAAFGAQRRVDDLAADDFEAFRADIAKSWGPVALCNEIGRIRVVFNYAYESGLIDKPMRYGPHFKKPSKKTLRVARAERGPRMLEAEEIRAILDVASPQLKAMILLGINCGFGNTDCGTLPLRALDLDGGWIDFPRPKTGIDRRCPLWPETVEALRIVLDDRQEPIDADYSDRVFVTKYRQPWIDGGTANPISAETRKLLKRPQCPDCKKMNDPKAEKCSCGWKPQGKSKWESIYRKGVGYYTLRHAHRTISDEAGDFPAIDRIMGHARDDMASIYRERISDDRLKAVTDHVRSWLFGQEA